MVDRTLIVRGAKCELARRSFWDYCKVKAPKFYKEDRCYLKEFANEMQDFIESDDKLMIVNLPPRPPRQISNCWMLCGMVAG